MNMSIRTFYLPDSKKGYVMNSDVFISYSSQDKQMAEEIYQTIEKNGLKCWIAPRDIPPGKKYAACIIEAIRNSSMMVIVFSSNSNNSDHVLTECEHAMSLKKIIIPFRIQEITPSDEMQYYINSRQWIDAFGPLLEEHLTKLVNRIRSSLDDLKNASKSDIQDKRAKTKAGKVKKVKVANIHKGRRNAIFAASFMLLLISVALFCTLFILDGADGDNKTAQKMTNFLSYVKKLVIPDNIATNNMQTDTENNTSQTKKASGDDYGDIFKSAADIIIGTEKAGAIESPGDVDFFRFTAKKDGHYLIESRTGTGDGMHGYIYSDDEMLLVRDDDHWLDDFEIDVELKANMTYFVKVKGSAINSIGTYSIVVNFVKSSVE